MDTLKATLLGARAGMQQAGIACRLKVPLQTCFRALLLKWLGKLNQALQRWEGVLCSHKSYARESQQMLGQLKPRRWKRDTSLHGAGAFPAESAKSS